MSESAKPAATAPEVTVPGGSAIQPRPVLWLITLVAVGLSLFQLYSAGIQPLGLFYQRSIHLMLIMMLAFLIFHLIQFTIVPGSMGGSGSEPHTMVVAGFQQAWLVVLYALCMVLVCMHVRHGFWSAFTTLGANTSANARKWLNILAYAVAAILYAGFMIMPLAVLFGVIGA